MIEAIITTIKNLANPTQAQKDLKFFQVVKGQYGEFDKFLGITNPQIRNIVKLYYKNIQPTDLNSLIINEYHEIRLFALLCLVEKVKHKIDMKEFKNIVDFYIKNVKFINNWDLEDLTAYKIIGRYCFLIDNYEIIYNFYNEKYVKNLKGNSELLSLWSKRISVVSTMFLIKKDKFDITIDLCEKLLNHKHHLIHKATGWMLREIGKRNENILIDFLQKHKNQMPRIMFRYATEKIDKNKFTVI